MGARYFLIVFVTTVAGCGGGGGGGGDGGGSTATPLTYSGNTSAAVVTPLNAGQLAADLTGAGDASAATGAAASGPSRDLGLLDVGRQLRVSFGNAARQPRDQGPMPTADVSIDETAPCAAGGSFRVFGTASDAGLGTLNVVFSECSDGANTVSGQAAMRIDVYDLANGQAVDYTVSFPRLTLRGSTNVDMTGSMRVQSNLGTNTETNTVNVVALYAGSGRMISAENLVWTDVYDNILSPASYVESVSGRIYDSVHGYVDASTNAPFVFGSLSQEFAQAGEIVLTGAGNAHVRLTALSTFLVSLALDVDGDGAYERLARLGWDAMSGPVGADLGDDDADGMHNAWESTHGLNPSSAADAASDPDGDSQTNLAEYQAGTNPTVANPASPVLPTVLTLAGSTDLVYDDVTQRLYATVSGNPGSIVPLDPLARTFGTPIPVGIDPTRLVLSGDGQYFYVGLGGEAAVRRLEVAPPHASLSIPLGTSTLFGARYAEDIAVLPGSPQSIAVSLKYRGSSPRHAGVAVFDDATARPSGTPDHTGSNVIEFSASAGTLYGYNNETTGAGFYRMAVDATGVSILDVYDSFQPGGPLIPSFGADMRFGGGLIFATTGAVVDPVARTVLGTVSLPFTFGNLVVPDAALGRVFYLANVSGSTWTLRAFDMATRNFLGGETITGVLGTPGSLVRWGTRGLAFRTNADRIYLIESTALIP